MFRLRQELSEGALRMFMNMAPDVYLFGNFLFSATWCSQQVKEKKKQLKKDGKPLDVEEDDHEVVSQSHRNT